MRELQMAAARFFNTTCNTDHNRQAHT
jgi:hypothetical protein